MIHIELHNIKPRSNKNNVGGVTRSKKKKRIQDKKEKEQKTVEFIIDNGIKMDDRWRQKERRKIARRNKRRAKRQARAAAC